MTITVIALVAIVMGMSVIAPMIPQADAHEVPPQVFIKAHKVCALIDPIPPHVFQRICVDGHG